MVKIKSHNVTSQWLTAHKQSYPSHIFLEFFFLNTEWPFFRENGAQTSTIWRTMNGDFIGRLLRGFGIFIDIFFLFSRKYSLCSVQFFWHSCPYTLVHAHVYFVFFVLLVDQFHSISFLVGFIHTYCHNKIIMSMQQKEKKKKRSDTITTVTSFSRSLTTDIMCVFCFLFIAALFFARAIHS